MIRLASERFSFNNILNSRSIVYAMGTAMPAMHIMMCVHALLSLSRGDLLLASSID